MLQNQEIALIFLRLEEMNPGDKSNFYKQLYEYRLTWFCLFAIFAIGFILRYLGCFDPNISLFMSGDDLGHIGFSGFVLVDHISNDIVKVFFDSYLDAHPPLRNLIVNLLLRFSDNTYLIRLVCFIPGVILIPVGFLFGYSIFLDYKVRIRHISGLVCSLIIATLPLLMLLSIETRPYCLMLVFELLAIVSMIFAIKRNSIFASIAFFILAMLTSFSDYSGITSIAALNIVLFCFMIFFNKSLWQKIISIAGSFSLLGSILFQYLELKKRGSLDAFLDTELRYVSSNYIDKFSDIPNHLFAAFKSFFAFHDGRVYLAPPINFELITMFIIICYFAGWIILAARKSYLLFFTTLLTLIMPIIAAFLHFAPFGAGRQSIHFLPFIIIPIAHLIVFLLQSKLAPISKLVFIIALVFFPYIQGFSLNFSSVINNLTNDANRFEPTPTRPKVFAHAIRWVLDNAAGKKIILSEHLNGRIHTFVRFKKLDLKFAKRTPNKWVDPDFLFIKDFRHWDAEWDLPNVCGLGDLSEQDIKCIQKLENFSPGKEYIFFGLKVRQNFNRGKMHHLGFTLKKSIYDYNGLYREIYVKN